MLYEALEDREYTDEDGNVREIRAGHLYRTDTAKHNEMIEQFPELFAPADFFD
jgi:hypothetical protein